MGLVAELKRRNVVRVAVAYVVVGWVLVEVASVVIPTFNAPHWIMQVFTFLVLLGFPLAVIFAWAFEMTPEGIVLDKDAPKDSGARRSGVRPLDYVLIVAVMLVGGYVLYGSFVSENVSGGVEAASVAVLPFENLSADAADEFFSDGITEDIITHLSKIPGLAVISRTTMMRYKDSGKSIREIGQELNVATVLEGSVRRAGERVRITGQLIAVDTDQHLWAEKYDRDLSDIFALQDEVAKAIASALRVQLTDEVGERLERKPTEDLAAYELYLRGRELSYRYEPEPTRQAITLLQQATELDPDYALAWAGLSLALVRLAYYEINPRLAEESWVAARRALELTPDLPEANFAMGYWYESAGNYPLMERHMRRTLAGNPNHAHAHDSLADIFMAAQGRLDDAIEEFDRALAADPYLIPSLGNKAVALIKLGRYRDARSALDVAVERYPEQFRSAEAVLVEAWGDRETQRALLLEEYEKLDDLGALALAGVSFLQDGQAPRAREILVQLESVASATDDSRAPPARQAAHYLRAHMAAAEGDMEDARRELNACRDPGLQFSGQVAAPRCIGSHEMTLGGMYFRLGDYASAVHWLEQVSDTAAGGEYYALGWWALKHYWLGRSWEALGEADKAGRSHATFLEMWNTADDDVPEIVDARERVAALSAQ